MHPFDHTPDQRRQLLLDTLQQLESFYAATAAERVTPILEPEEVRRQVRSIDFSEPAAAGEAIGRVIRGLRTYAVHTPHPKYFGLFNPRPVFAGIVADLITAVFNPQMAAWSHAPFANEAENYVVQEMGRQFGYAQDSTDGVFATGGAEANLTAVLCALNHHFPDFAASGLIGMHRQPLIYCSAEAHHSVDKAARSVGLGLQSVRHIPVGEDLRMDIGLLQQALQQDRQAGHRPFLLVGTAGTTGTGAIDELPELRRLADEYGLWLHADAAYGGAAVLHPGLKPYLRGIETADSITFDAHKWMSLPMAASLFLTRHPAILSRTFSIVTDYMPQEAREMPVTDPFTHSIQWSRRFTGLKLYLALSIYGWEGYKEVIGQQTRIGNYLKEQLWLNDWQVMNDTPFPVACFRDRQHHDEAFTQRLLQRVLQAGQSWISRYHVHGQPCLRACITNYATTKKEIDELIAELNRHREE